MHISQGCFISETKRNCFMKKLFFSIVLLFFTVSVFGSNYNIRQTRNFQYDEEVFHNKWTDSIRGDSLNCTVVGRALFGPNNAVFVKDSIAYSCNGYSLLLLNIKDPSHPVLISYYDTGAPINDIYIQDTLDYVADEGDGLRIINVSDPQNPIEIGYYDTDSSALSVYCLLYTSPSPRDS